MKNEKADRITQQNIALLGDSGVGKTSLARALRGENFDAMTTITHGISQSTIDNDSGAMLIDFGGEENRSDILNRLKKFKPAVAIFVIDARREESQDRLEYWNTLLTESQENQNIQKYLVVSKYDIGKPIIDTNIFIQKFGFADIHQTSVKEGTGIQELRSAVRNAVVVPDEENEEEFGNVAKIIRVMADCLCEAVAKNPAALHEIEWRDLERLIARALEEIGFSVVLTPPAKDGGKDIIANCIVENEEKIYYIEIKHWRKRGRPGTKQIYEFIEVNACDNTNGGLFISASGFTDIVYGRLSELSRQNVRLGNQDKIVSLCQQYIRKRDGFWCCKTPLPELLFAQTLN
jgi:small GTP-binding protein